MPTFATITHDAFVAAIHTLRDTIAASGWAPDFVIGIGRGGLTPAVYLSHAAGVPMLSVDHSSQVADFADDLLVRLAARTRAGERLLFLDDINDSGRTIAHIRAALAAAGADAANIRVATLIDNIRSTERVDHAARVIDRHVMKDWFVFPWEAVAPAQSIADDAAEVPGRIA
ncbi:MAG: phosphoribosyltransferase family protein [Sphingomonas taxi]